MSAIKKKIELVKPPALRPGDTIGIVAPASQIQKELLEAGCARLSELGYRTFYKSSIYDNELFFAGSVERRCRELEEMFERDDVQAVICARGGYGSNTLLEKLDLEKIRLKPKIFIGYSDITTLLTYLHDRAQMITFHGPMVTKDFVASGQVDTSSWNNAMSGANQWLVAADEIMSLIRGQAEGRLYGGCLSMLVASLGTPFEIITDDTILFVEDTNVKPFQVDRMLMHLKLAGKFDNIRGIIFGEMCGCGDTQLLIAGIKRLVSDMGIPVALGLRSGHVSGRNVTLPIGVNASLIVGDRVQITILEAAVSAETPQSTSARSRA